MKTYLVTGGAGFIGSHLCERLINRGDRIICIDNFNDFYSPSIKKQNISSLHTNTSFILKEVDIRNLNALESIFSSTKIDVVIHLAAMAGVRPSIENPLLYEDVNIKGTLNILECMKKYGLKKLVFASSSSVYGNNKKLPFEESDIVDYSISPYAFSKKSCETNCFVYYHLYNIDIAILRFFTVYGPRQRPDLAIHKFTEKIFKNEKIPFYGDGTSKRDYTYVNDTIDGIIKSIRFIEASKNVFEIFNLGESQTISLNKVVHTIENEIGIEANIKKLPKQDGDVNITYANISKAKKILGYNPLTTFEEGITIFVKWYSKEVLKN